MRRRDESIGVGRAHATPRRRVYAPVPVRNTPTGETGSSLATSRSALRAPVAVGLNASCTVHVAPTGSLAYAQVVRRPFRMTKSPEFEPVSDRFPTFRSALPVLVTVAVAAWLRSPTRTLPKSMITGVPDALPLITVPVSGTLCVPRPSVTFSVPCATPAPTGRNPTWTMHESAGPSVMPEQASASTLKTPPFVAAAVTASGEPPVLLNVTAASTTCRLPGRVPKSTLAGSNVAAGGGGAGVCD